MCSFRYLRIIKTLPSQTTLDALSRIPRVLIIAWCLSVTSTSLFIVAEVHLARAAQEGMPRGRPPRKKDAHTHTRRTATESEKRKRAESKEKDNAAEKKRTGKSW